MRIGIIAEGHADVNIIKAVIKTLTGIDKEDMVSIRPSEQRDETDNKSLNYSNWYDVLQTCSDANLLTAFFDVLEEDAIMVVQIDTAERGSQNYGVPEPQRTGSMDWKIYSDSLYAQVKTRINSLIPQPYREKVAYAIAIEETDAWIIPLFANKYSDTSSIATPKEHLQKLIKGNKAYVDTAHKNLDYEKLGKAMAKKLNSCRSANQSLNLFCLDIESRLSPETSPIVRQI